MTTLSPKTNFIRFQANAAEDLKIMRESAGFTVGAVYALAEMANLGATQEQLLGARNFIHILQNLWDKGEPATKLPVTRLETYDLSSEQLEALAKAKPQKE
jgi:hypothetical protein